MTVIPLKVATDICVRGDASKLRFKTVDLAERNELGETFLHVAAQHSAECLAAVCGQPGVVLDVQTTGERRHNETPLHLAAAYGNEASIKYLLSRNSALAEKTDRNGRTPLEYAIDKVNKSHRAHVCAELLAKYTDLPALVRRCLTAKPLRILETLIWITKYTTVDLCGPESQNALGQTPLMVASLFGQPAVVRALLEQPVERRGGVDDSSSQMQSTPLLLAVQGYCWQVRAGYSPERHWECAVLLLRAGADVNARDSHLNTALHRAATWNQPALIARLLEFGANAVILNGSGHTPIEFAHERGITLGGGDPHWECVSELYDASDFAVTRLFARMLDTKPVCVAHIHRLFDMAARSTRFTPQVLWSSPHPFTGVPLAHVALSVLEPPDCVALLSRIEHSSNSNPNSNNNSSSSNDELRFAAATSGITDVRSSAATTAPAIAKTVTISRPVTISAPRSKTTAAPVEEGVVLGASPDNVSNASVTTKSVVSSRAASPSNRSYASNASTAGDEDADSLSINTSQGTCEMSGRDLPRIVLPDADADAGTADHDVTLGGQQLTVHNRDHLQLDMTCLNHTMEERMVEDLAIGLSTPVLHTPVCENAPTDTIRRCLRSNNVHFTLQRRV